MQRGIIFAFLFALYHEDCLPKSSATTSFSSL